MNDIFVFTVNNAASMLLYEVGKTLARHARLPFWSVNDGTFPEKGLAEDPNAFDGKHGCFCPLRYYTEVPRLDEATDAAPRRGLHDEASGFVQAAPSATDAAPRRGLHDEASGFVQAARSAATLHLRDPRDVITSQFYSLAYSHPPVAGRFNPTDAPAPAVDRRRRRRPRPRPRRALGRALPAPTSTMSSVAPTPRSSPTNRW